MHEDLLGYLLGALEPDEMQRVSEWLKDNPEGQRQLAEIERSLRPLEDGFETFDGPSDDLLARTLDALPPGLPPSDVAADDSTLNEPALPAARPVLLADVDLSRESGRNSGRWSMVDSVGGLLSVATLLALLLPMIAAGRFEARKRACQDQLRELGTALMQYAYRDGQNRLPPVAESGPEAHAGVYAMRLADAGLMPDPMKRWCPSAELPSLESTLPPLAAEPRIDWVRTLPAVTTLAQMDVNELQRVQRLAGGNYAYSLGVVSEQGYGSPRFEARTSFAVMADAPLVVTPQQSGETTPRFSHGDQGINVLYEDGAVRFVRVEALDSMPDHPFLNHNGKNEAGVNIDDASLAPSFRGPFNSSLQR